MKTSTLLFAVSAVANVALVIVLLSRPSPEAPARTAALAGAAPAKAPTGNADAIRAALASGDPAALQAAGFSADVARDIALGRAFGRFADKMRASQSAATNTKWWKRSGASANQTREQMLSARRELSDAMIAAFGDDLGIGGADNGQLSFLPAAKRDKLRSIIQDYDEMLAKFGGEGGIQLASDREKQKLLRAERDRDIAALLTPEELAIYEMRTSPTTAQLRSRYGDAIETEEDFRKIYALQKAFDEKFPPLSGRITPDMMTGRAEGLRQLQDDMKAALGADKYAALRRAADNDVRTLDSLAGRLNLAASSTDNVLTARDVYAQESQRINADPALTPAQKRQQITELGNRARSDVARTLGAEGTDVYAQRSSWLNMLQNGMAFSTTPPTNGPGALTLGLNGGQSVYPVMPTGPVGGAPGAVRQMVVNGVTTSDLGGGGGAGPGGGIFMIPAERAVQRDNVVMFSTSTTESTTPPGTPTTAPAGGATGSAPATPRQ